MKPLVLTDEEGTAELQPGAGGSNADVLAVVVKIRRQGEVTAAVGEVVMTCAANVEVLIAAAHEATTAAVLRLAIELDRKAAADRERG